MVNNKKHGGRHVPEITDVAAKPPSLHNQINLIDFIDYVPSCSLLLLCGDKMRK